MRPPALSPVQAHEAIERLIERPATLALTEHARTRMKERHFTIDDVLWVLRRGSVSANPEWDEKRETWKYLIRHCGRDGEPLTLVVAIEDRITVVTGHD
jgi:hypothetical protein